MFRRLAEFVHDRRWLVIACWVAGAVVLRLAAPAWSTVARDSDIGELPSDTTSARGAQLNAAAFPDDRTRSQIVLVVARESERLTAADRQLALGMAARLKEIPDLPLVGEVWTPRTPVIGDMLESPGGQAVEVVARLTNDFMAVDNVRVMRGVHRLIAESRARAPEGLQIGLTGSAAIGGDLLTAMGESLRNTEWATIVAVAIALGAIYRSLWLVIVPLGAIAIATVTSIDLLALLARWSQIRGEGAWPEFRIYSTTKIFIVVLLFGAGTDFCLFLIARFRELRAKGATQREAIVESVARVGSAISASALTTIVGLAMMVFSAFGKFTYSGPAIAISLGVALLVCLTLAPALLSTWIGSRVTAQSGSLEATPGHWLWRRLADLVIARPGLVLAGSVLLAAPFAINGLNTRVTYDIFSELPLNAESRRGTGLLLQHLPPGEIGPLTVLARLPGEVLTSEEGREKVAALTKRLFDLEGVDKVRSLYRPTGEPPGAVSWSTRGLTSLVAAGSPLAEEAFVSQTGPYRGEVTRLTVVLDDAPFSPTAVGTVSTIEASLAAAKAESDSPWHDAQFEMLGVTVGIRDLERVTIADRRRIEILVTLAVFLVILALLRRPLVCLYLIATVVANYFVTLGAVNFILYAIHGSDWIGLDWKAPIFLFVILVAVGQDYNIFLVTRVFEEQQHHGPLAGLRRGLVQTGGIITSCGVIMAATFGSMISGSLPEMAEMGFALALGILLDTFVVRTVLAPAFLALAAKWQVPATGPSPNADG
jgi:RND superfamily putative drug exporter